MTYASRQNMIDAFGELELVQLTDQANPPLGMIDDTTLAKTLAFADALIDTLISLRYPVPVSPVPDILVDYACDIARYRLYRDAPTEEVRRRFEDARKYLQDVAAGRALLGATAPEPSAGEVQFADSPRVFSRDDL